MRTRQVIALLVGAVLGIAALGALAGGGLAIWAHTTQRDDDGYYTSSTERLSTDTAAITSERIDLGTDQGEGEWNPIDDIGTIRIEVERPDGADVFVGIAPDDDVEAYLDGVAHEEVSSIEDGDPRYDEVAGEGSAEAPTRQGFWAASAFGPGAQRVEWDLEEGDWAVVVMNADASEGLTVEASAGLRTGWLLPIGIGLLAVGLVLASVAIGLLLLALRPGRAGADEGAGAAPPGGPIDLTTGSVPAGTYRSAW